MTAVEFLIEEVECRGITTKELRLAFEQAKEMGKQQQGYSEEEVLAILNEIGWGFYGGYTGNIPISEWMLNAFEQFKKK